MNILIRSMSSRAMRSEEHTSELQSLTNLVCRLLLEKKKCVRRLDAYLAAPCPPRFRLTTAGPRPRPPGRAPSTHPRPHAPQRHRQRLPLFFKHPPPAEIYPLSPHGPLPI